MRAGHTPGPWKYFRNCDCEYSIFQAGDGHFDANGKGYAANVLAVVEGEENAKLIAAAPDMKALLKDAVWHLRADGGQAGEFLKRVEELLARIGEAD